MILSGFVAALATHRFAIEFDAVSVVHQAVENGIGDRRIANLRVPGCDRELAGEQHRARLVAGVTDLEEVPALRFRQWRHGPIIDGQHVHMAELVEMFRMAAVSARRGQVAKQLGGF